MEAVLALRARDRLLPQHFGCFSCGGYFITLVDKRSTSGTIAKNGEKIRAPVSLPIGCARIPR